ISDATLSVSLNARIPAVIDAEVLPGQLVVRHQVCAPLGQGLNRDEGEESDDGKQDSTGNHQGVTPRSQVLLSLRRYCPSRGADPPGWTRVDAGTRAGSPGRPSGGSKRLGGVSPQKGAQARAPSG